MRWRVPRVSAFQRVGGAMPKALLCLRDFDVNQRPHAVDDRHKVGRAEQAADRIEERHLHDHERRASETALIAPLLESLVTVNI